MELRTATADDLDQMANIMCAAFPMDPQWDYRFPHRLEYPEDNWSCTREMLSNFLKKDHFVVKVITSKSNEDEDVVKSVALAVWELQYQEATPTAIDDDGTRRDADPERMKAFEAALTKAKKTFFDDVYGDKQVHLWILGTHPDYQRRGAGAKHCRWGISQAKENTSALTLFSSPMGQNLYTSLGFKVVGNVTVQVEGEEEKLSIGAMAYETVASSWRCCVM